jgi:hypothetical protein
MFGVERWSAGENIEDEFVLRTFAARAMLVVRTQLEWPTFQPFGGFWTLADIGQRA